jgi:hypothetical protein
VGWSAGEAGSERGVCEVECRVTVCCGVGYYGGAGSGCCYYGGAGYGYYFWAGSGGGVEGVAVVLFVLLWLPGCVAPRFRERAFTVSTNGTSALACSNAIRRFR